MPPPTRERKSRRKGGTEWPRQGIVRKRVRSEILLKNEKVLPLLKQAVPQGEEEGRSENKNMNTKEGKTASAAREAGIIVGPSRRGSKGPFYKVVNSGTILRIHQRTVQGLENLGRRVKRKRIIRKGKSESYASSRNTIRVYERLVTGFAVQEPLVVGWQNPGGGLDRLPQKEWPVARLG